MNKKKKNLIKELSQKYDGTCEPACKHFGKCGGCMFQNFSYEDQLHIKRDYLNNLLDGIMLVEKVQPSTPFNYRNRMDMVTAFGKVGLREAGSYKFVADIESCEIMQEKSNQYYQKVRTHLKDIEQYNYLSHKGYNRYVILRQAMYTGQVMMNFVIAREENKITHIIDEVKDEVDSISILFNDGLADLSFGSVFENVKKGYIEEDFDGIKYRITPNSFFQSNSEIALKMYREIKRFVSGKVLDLYSGVGSISLYVAENSEKVLGVEEIDEAVETANVNMEQNKIKNAEFICADVKPFIREHDEQYETLILDPPRSGINPKILKHLNRLKPEKIIYMSCNPAMFKNDMTAFEDYKIDYFEAFDMFPQTPHVETLALLKRK